MFPFLEVLELCVIATIPRVSGRWQLLILIVDEKDSNAENTG